MALYEVTSGNIVEYNIYQVVGGTSVIYNSVEYLAGSYFVGVNGVTTYTKTGGTEIVTDASTIVGAAFGIENDFYTRLFNDDSKVLGLTIGFGDRVITMDRAVLRGNKLISINGRFIKILQ